MADAVKRRITILDVMAVVAMTAVSIVGARYMLSLMKLPPGWWRVSALLGSSAAVLTATLALIPLRLRHPRPYGERLWRQPGWLACAAVALTLAISLAQQLLEVAFIVIRLGPSRLDLSSLSRELMLAFPSKATGGWKLTQGLIGSERSHRYRNCGAWPYQPDAQARVRRGHALASASVRRLRVLMLRVPRPYQSRLLIESMGTRNGRRCVNI
jgi:hypothetical protein